MTHSEAVALIQDAVTTTNSPQTWADFGAGSGTFTSALSSLLPAYSTIHAIDVDTSALSLIRLNNQNVHLVTKSENFEKSIIDLPLLDGIILANSLHYIEHQEKFLQKIKTVLKPEGSVIIVEYDRKSSNRWVPFPVSFDSLVQMAKFSKFNTIKKIAERRSVFDGVTMYSALLKQG